MTASGKKLLESKDNVVHITDVPHDLFALDGGIRNIRELIYNYAFDPDAVGSHLTKEFTFFGISSSFRSQILSLAHYAAPLDQVEACVSEAYARNEKHLPDTLITAICKAVKDCDLTSWDSKLVREPGFDRNKCEIIKYKEIAKGMAEKLMELYQKFFPCSYSRCLEAVKFVAPFEVENKTEARKSLNREATNKVFDAIKSNENTSAAILTYNEFVKSSTPINRLHLLDTALQILVRRGDELPKKDKEPIGGWYGKLADRFCFEVIRDGIESTLPMRIRQILNISSRQMYSGGPQRDLNLDGFSVMNVRFNSKDYKDSKDVEWRSYLRRAPVGRASSTLMLISSNYTKFQNFLYCDQDQNPQYQYRNPMEICR